jgi:hypothetical protein
MRATRPRRALEVVLLNVGKLCDRAIAIERATAVGNPHVQDPAGPKHAEVISQSADRVFTVLDEVIGYYEVNRRVRHATQHLAVIQDVRLDEVEVVELGIMLAELW